MSKMARELAKNMTNLDFENFMGSWQKKLDNLRGRNCVIEGQAITQVME